MQAISLTNSGGMEQTGLNLRRNDGLPEIQRTPQCGPCFYLFLLPLPLYLKLFTCNDNAFKYIQIVRSLREAKLGYLLVPKYHYAYVRNNGLTPPPPPPLYANVRIDHTPSPPLLAYVLNGCPQRYMFFVK
jgi:hypothetical protein